MCGIGAKTSATDGKAVAIGVQASGEADATIRRREHPNLAIRSGQRGRGRSEASPYLLFIPAALPTPGR